jgi:hypothetical protein
MYEIRTYVRRKYICTKYEHMYKVCTYVRTLNLSRLFLHYLLLRVPFCSAQKRKRSTVVNNSTVKNFLVLLRPMSLHAKSTARERRATNLLAARATSKQTPPFFGPKR